MKHQLCFLKKKKKKPPLLAFSTTALLLKPPACRCYAAKRIRVSPQSVFLTSRCQRLTLALPDKRRREPGDAHQSASFNHRALQLFRRTCEVEHPLWNVQHLLGPASCPRGRLKQALSGFQTVEVLFGDCFLFISFNYQLYLSFSSRINSSSTRCVSRRLNPG